jgi:methyl-accepting chemotaxis protein
VGPSAGGEGGRGKGDGGAPLGISLFQDMTALVSALVHETQRERGVSSLYAASGGRRFGAELSAQWRATDLRREELGIFRERHEAGLPSAAAGQLARGEELLRNVVAGRGRIEDLETAPREIVAAYSHLNAELLQVIDGLIARAVEPRHHATALAWMALLYAKEKTGIERAQLVSAFERDRFSDGQYQAVLGAIASRQSYLHLFGAAAPAPVIEILRAPPASEVTVAFEQMERVALAHRRGGFGIDPTAWFAIVSRQIELLGDVESALRAGLAPSTAA